MDVRLDMDMQIGNGLRHAASIWTWICSMDIDMQYGYRHAAWTMVMFHAHGLAPWTLTHSIDMDVQPMDTEMDMQHEHAFVGMDMNMQHGQ